MQGKGSPERSAATQVYAGIDVCKARLDVFVHPIGQKLTVGVNGGVKAGHWGGAKTGQFAAWASSTTRHGRPGGDGRGFVAGAAMAFRRRG